jgi:5-methylcytosine-specific restriction endonuclease McrA
MPTSARHHQPTRISGCRNHAGEVYEAERRQTDASLALAMRLRSGKRWQVVRAWVLADAPLCADPHGHHARYGETVLAAEVDHVIGLTLRPDLAFAAENLMPLCRACHAQKSAAERMGKSLSTRARHSGSPG